MTTDEQVTRFDQWWCSSKYLQVIKPVCGWRDIAWDSWRAAQATAPPSAPTPAAPKGRQRYRHVKTGGEYEYIDVGQLESAPGVLQMVYQSVANGVVWIRPLLEFMDGRFVEVYAPTPEVADLAPPPRLCDNVDRFGQECYLQKGHAGRHAPVPPPTPDLMALSKQIADRGPDTRTDEQIIADGVRFVMGPGGDEGTRFRSAPTPAADDRNGLAGKLIRCADAARAGYLDSGQVEALLREAAAEIARLRAVVRAADAMRADAYQEDMSSVGCPPSYMVDRPTSVALAYDDARKDVTL